MTTALEEQFKRQSFGIIPSVTFNLEPDAKIIAHPGTLLMADPQIVMSLRVFNQAEEARSLWEKIKRGASKTFIGQFLSAEFTNSAADAKSITLHPNHGGSVVWIDADKYDGTIICKKHGFLASTDPDVHLDIVSISSTTWQKLAADQEIFLERVTSRTPGADHHIFLSSASAAMEIKLNNGEEKNLHANSLLAATADVHISLRLIPGFVNRNFGNEGKRYTVVKGPGTIWLQTSNPLAAGSHGGGLGGLSEFAVNIAPV